MNPADNPFAPGAGTPPPELAGRSGTIDDAAVAVARAKKGLAAKSALLLGLRGVGKTVLLNRIAENALTERCLTISLEAPEGGRLAALLVPPLRQVLFRLSAVERAKDAAGEALGVLRAFASAFKVKVGEVEFGVKPRPGVADFGDLQFDLPQLFTTVAAAARADERALVLLIDEVQYLSAEELGAIIVAVHHVGQKGLPFVLFGAGLPQLAALAGEAKSYAERLFDCPAIGPLTRDAAADAIRAPLSREGVDIEAGALDAIVATTKGYPYFLQEWGYQSWNAAPASPITVRDVRVANVAAVARLDQGFFKVRFDRLTPREKAYMRAMATLGPGPHRSGEIARALKKKVSEVAPLRNGLIKRGMIFSPQHGDTAFTVPMFDQFLLRAMPTPPTQARRREPRR